MWVLITVMALATYAAAVTFKSVLPAAVLLAVTAVLIVVRFVSKGSGK